MIVALAAQPAESNPVTWYCKPALAALKMATGLAISTADKANAGDQLYRKPPLASNCKGWPVTTAVSFPALICNLGIQVTKTVSVPAFGQPSNELAGNDNPKFYCWYQLA